jgi:hypothetical protein
MQYHFCKRNEKLNNFWEKLKFWRRQQSRPHRTSKNDESKFIELTPTEIREEEEEEKKKVRENRTEIGRETR